MEHYHVMTEGELGDQQQLGGLIYQDLLDAAHEFWLRCQKGDPRYIASLARDMANRGKILRARGADGEPYAYLAICTLDTCDLKRMIRTTIVKPWDRPSEN